MASFRASTSFPTRPPNSGSLSLSSATCSLSGPSCPERGAGTVGDCGVDECLEQRQDRQGISRSQLFFTQMFLKCREVSIEQPAHGPAWSLGSRSSPGNKASHRACHFSSSPPFSPFLFLILLPPASPSPFLLYLVDFFGVGTLQVLFHVGNPAEREESTLAVAERIMGEKGAHPYPGAFWRCCSNASAFDVGLVDRGVLSHRGGVLSHRTQGQSRPDRKSLVGWD